MLNNHIRLGNSIATSLIKKVFGIYFIVTIIVTCIQLTNEYVHIKESIIRDIKKMEKTFQTGLAKALWNYNNEQLQAIIRGMNELSILVGIRIDYADGTGFRAAGVILEKNRQIFVTSDGKISGISFTPLKGIFFHRFDIFHKDPLSNKIIPVGKATLYSSSGVVLDRIKYGFFLIIINSVIKTAVLWFIIIYFVRRIIGRPLDILTEITEKMNPANPDFFEIRYSSEEKKLLRSENELGILSRSFDKMRNAILERIANLNSLRDIGEDLTSVREIPGVFERIMKIMKEKFAFRKGSISLSEDQERFRIIASYPDPETGSFRKGEGVAGKASESQKIIYMPDNSGFAETEDYILCVPLTDENGLSGVMSFSDTKDVFALTDENRVFLEAAARLALISIKNIRMMEIMEEHARLTQELKIARRIQSVLLPEKPEISGYDIAASCEPADEVGGDYYDVISVGGYDWIVVGDVSGHGLTAGLVMMMVQTAINTVLLRDPDMGPSDLLATVNKTIYENIEKMRESKHMTIVVLAAGKDGFFSFAGLHEDMLIWRSAHEKIEAVETDGMWIGLEPDISHLLSDNTLRLNTGDCMVLYTDGITEARCKYDQMFGDERLREIVEESGPGSASEIHATILQALDTCERPDDVTLFVMKRI